METGTFSDKVFLIVTGLTGFQAYVAILFVLFACGLGVPIPEDITLFAAGILAYAGHISLTGALVVGFIGVLTGDCFLFLIGRQFGRQVIQWPYFRRIFTPERIAKAEKKLQKRKKLVCFLARFMPGLRAPIFLTSGILRVPFRIFILMDGLAAMISVPIWILLAYHLGDQLETLFSIAKQAKVVVIILLALLIGFYLVKHHRKKLKRKQSQARQ